MSHPPARKGTPIPRSRTSHPGSAKAGGEISTHFSTKFCTLRAQWPGSKKGTPLRFCPPDVKCQVHSKASPVKWGSRGRPPMSTGVSQVLIEGCPLVPFKVNCPEGAREGGLGHWFLFGQAKRNTRPIPLPAPQGEPHKKGGSDETCHSHKHLPYGRRGEAELRRKFFVKLSFKKAG